MALNTTMPMTHNIVFIIHKSLKDNSATDQKYFSYTFSFPNDIFSLAILP